MALTNRTLSFSITRSDILIGFNVFEPATHASAVNSLCQGYSSEVCAGRRCPHHLNVQDRRLRCQVGLLNLWPTVSGQAALLPGRGYPTRRWSCGVVGQVTCPCSVVWIEAPIKSDQDRKAAGFLHLPLMSVIVRTPLFRIVTRLPFPKIRAFAPLLPGLSGY